VHSTLQAVAPEALSAYNLPRLYAACLLNAPAYRDAVWSAAHSWSRAGGFSGVALRTAIGREFVRAAASKTWTLALRAMRPTAAGGRLYLDRIADIGACQGPYEALYARARSGPGLAALLRSIEQGSGLPRRDD